MALMTMMRERMHVVLWALLAVFLLSMAIGGLVGGAGCGDSPALQGDEYRSRRRLWPVDHDTQ